MSNHSSFIDDSKKLICKKNKILPKFEEIDSIERIIEKTEKTLIIGDRLNNQKNETNFEHHTKDSFDKEIKNSISTISTQNSIVKNICHMIENKMNGNLNFFKPNPSSQLNNSFDNYDSFTIKDFNQPCLDDNLILSRINADLDQTDCYFVDIKIDQKSKNNNNNEEIVEDDDLKSKSKDKSKEKSKKSKKDDFERKHSKSTDKERKKSHRSKKSNADSISEFIAISLDDIRKLTLTSYDKDFEPRNSLELVEKNLKPEIKDKSNKKKDSCKEDKLLSEIKPDIFEKKISPETMKDDENSFDRKNVPNLDSQNIINKEGVNSDLMNDSQDKTSTQCVFSSKIVPYLSNFLNATTSENKNLWLSVIENTGDSILNILTLKDEFNHNIWLSWLKEQCSSLDQLSEDLINDIEDKIFKMEHG